MNIVRLEAPEGKILTDGVVYGKVIVFREGIDNPDNYYEITTEEYKKVMEDLETDKD